MSANIRMTRLVSTSFLEDCLFSYFCYSQNKLLIIENPCSQKISQRHRLFKPQLINGLKTWYSPTVANFQSDSSGRMHFLHILCETKTSLRENSCPWDFYDVYHCKSSGSANGY